MLSKLIPSPSAMLAILLVLVCPPALADVWQGTIGKLPVVVELQASDKGLSGRYFYRKYRIDIELAPNGPGRAEEEIPQDEWKSEGAPVWILQDASGTTLPAHLQGIWQGGHDLPISLSRVTRDSLPPSDDPGLAELRDRNVYDYLRLSGLALKPGKRQVIDGRTLRWWREPVSGVRLFDIVSGYPDDAREQINRALRKRLWSEVFNYFDCMSSAGGMGKGAFDQRTTLRHVGAAVISVSVFTDYYCGGAHPDFSDAPLNLDARDGHELSLEDVLWLGQGVPPRESTDSDAFFAYRDHVLAPWLAEQMAALYPEQVGGDSDPDSDDCYYGAPDVWNFPSWYVTDQGLYLGPGFARYARACEYPEWSVLPWRLVEQHPGAVKIAPPSLR